MAILRLDLLLQIQQGVQGIFGFYLLLTRLFDAGHVLDDLFAVLS
jgi:hypothetical protein